MFNKILLLSTAYLIVKKATKYGRYENLANLLNKERVFFSATNNKTLVKAGRNHISRTFPKRATARSFVDANVPKIEIG